ELYDVETDPNEINNRFQDPELADITQGLIDTHLKPIRNRLDEDRYNHWQEIRANKRRNVQVLTPDP
ncbi:MAG: hypothetical protein QGG64_14480, partial [Candidatus Latescibacteria bacterium]|nr:hypothetical protein [Candidatus Latescibacterota bacterium]